MAQIATNTGQQSLRKRHAIHLDMTPMVDLAFLLLTFFILTVTLQDPFVMKMNVPPDEPDHAPLVNASQVVTVILGEHNSVYYYQGNDQIMHKTNFSPGGIRKVLIDKNSEISKMVVLIKPSKESRYQNLIDILDEVTISHVQYYYIVKETSEDRKLVANAKLAMQ